MCCLDLSRSFQPSDQHDAHVRDWFWWTVIALVLFNPDKTPETITQAIATVERVRLRLIQGLPADWPAGHPAPGDLGTIPP